jgi:RimJ/RimL family protein N-acetyltransferase
MHELGGELPTIDAGEVRLRTLRHDDVPALFAIFGDPEVTRYWGFATLPDLAAAGALVEQIHAQAAAGTLFQWGIEAHAELVGTCTLSSIDRCNRRAELGFALASAHQRRGYVAAALPALLRHAFDAMDLHRLHADTDPRNTRSIRVLERLGFRREGLLREHYLVTGEAQDALVFGLLRSEWRARCRAGEGHDQEVR